MRKVLISFFVIFIVGIFAAPVLAEDYEYQTTHESPEWANMDHPQMLAATQIAQSELDEMDTAVLLNAVLDYPLLVDIFLFNSLEQGVNVLRSRFNGLDELLNREDIGQAIINRYGSLSMQRGGRAEFKLMALDAMLSATVVFEQLSEEEQEEIAEMMVQSTNMGMDKHFIDSGSGIDQEIMAAASYVTTPKGSQVSAVVYGEEYGSSEINQINAEVAASYPNAQRLRNPTTNYNCHSYALYSTLASNIYWIPHPSSYFTDGSYVHVGSYPTAVSKGCITH
ncbi:MAG: hypothetical protein LBL49_04150 [Clostridiales Family XIII bacterium]|jgi:hypothetical protein|nr:hypothetical protein [Clostridiales Family XIII bacterium]